MQWTEKQLQEALKGNPSLSISKSSQYRLKEETSLKSTQEPEKHKRHAIGTREDLNQFFRSSWEANIARYYNFVKIKWQYEIKEFMFPVKRGCISYKPDFYLPELDRWIEVKGYMDQKSKTKLSRFQKYYPEEYKKLEIISATEYKEIAKFKNLIPDWETVNS